MKKYIWAILGITTISLTSLYFSHHIHNQILLISSALSMGIWIMWTADKLFDK